MSITPKQLTNDLSVSAQIMPDDLDAIKEAGFKSVIINRPDSEMPGQPEASDLASLLTENGLESAHIPMAPGQLSPDLVAAMSDAIENLPKPILAFCASGTRSTVLWCCASVKEQGVDAVLKTAADAGYELEQIRPLLNQLNG